MLRSQKRKLNAVARMGAWAAIFATQLFSRIEAKEAEAAPPVFSVAGGVYTNNLVLELKAEQAVVRISFDGSEPGLSSPAYERPIAITNCALVRAKAWYSDGRVSATVSQSYILLDDDLRQFSSNLPLIIVQSADGEIAPVEKSLVGTRIIGTNGSRASLLAAADFDGLAMANVRGHSSLRYPKHSYTVKTVNELGDAHRVSLLGLPKESDWVLYGPYPDKTLMRDVLAYELSNDMGRWAPHTRFVEVFVVENPARLGMEHYAGVYVLAEKITRDKNRVDITKLEPSMNREPEISGGYIFKKDHTSRRERKQFDAEGPPNAPLVTNRVGFPTGPGGFPGDPEGFLPAYSSKTVKTETTTRNLGNRLRAVDTGLVPVEVANLVAPTPALGAAPPPPPPPVRTPSLETPPPPPIQPRPPNSVKPTVRAGSRVVSPPIRGSSVVRKKPKIDPNAPTTNYVAVAIPEPTKIDDEKIFHDDEAFRTTLQRNQFYFYEPEPDELTAVQRAWLKDYVNRFEAALYGADFTNASTGYRAFIDADSFIDYHLLTEMTKNVDSFRFSTFYYKDRGGLLNMGPLWDWNLAFGNANGKQGYMPEHWLWPQLDDQQYSWFRRLFEDPDFGQRYVDRWAQLRTNVLATTRVLSRIDQFAAQVNEAQERNFEKWEILGKNVNPNWFVGDSFDEEINWMKQWVSNRLDWMEKQFVPAPAVLQGESIKLLTTVADGKIFFTLDGADPRAPGGGVAATARPYESPLPKNSRLTARVQSGNRWSPVAVHGR